MSDVNRFGAYSREIEIFDPEARTVQASPIEISGDTPPKPTTTWWPWIIAAGVLGALWWLTREDELHGPLAGGAG